MPKYQRLDAAAVQHTVERLRERIEARFPERNLRHVADELTGAIEQALVVPHPRWLVVARTLSRLLIAGILTLVGVAFVLIVIGGIDDSPTAWEWIPIVEATINDVVFAGIAVFFLWHFPNRMQRAHDLRALHRLRSLAHVIDMHQLTKDPDRLSPGYRPTAESIDPGLDAHELWAYFNYCTELLSLVGKAAALLAEQNTDDTVLATVEGLEDLTTGMSRKIWQKIALLPVDEAPATPAAYA